MGLKYPIQLLTKVRVTDLEVAKYIRKLPSGFGALMSSYRSDPNNPLYQKDAQFIERENQRSNEISTKLENGKDLSGEEKLWLKQTLEQSVMIMKAFIATGEMDGSPKGLEDYINNLG